MGAQPRPEDVDAAFAPERQVAQRPAVHRRRRRVEPEASARPQDRLFRARPDEGLSPRGCRDGREGRQGQSQEIFPPLGRQRRPEGGRLHRPAERQVGPARRARAALPLPAPHPGPGGERRVQGWLERHGRLHADGQRGRAQAGAQGAQGRLLGRRAVPRPDRVHRSRRRPRRRGERARLQAGGRPLWRRHRPARGAAEDPARADVPGGHGVHGDRAHAAGEALRRQARAPGHAIRHRLERGPPDRPPRSRPARRAPSRQLRASGVREAAAPAARCRPGQEAARGGGLPERHRRRDHLPAAARLGAPRRADHGGAVEGGGHPRQDQRHALHAVLGGVDQGAVRLHHLGPPPARDHEPGPGLSLGRPVERVQVFQSRVRPLAQPGGRHPRRRLATRDHGQARGHPARRRADRAAGVAEA